MASVSARNDCTPVACNKLATVDADVHSQSDPAGVVAQPFASEPLGDKSDRFPSEKDDKPSAFGDEEPRKIYVLSRPLVKGSSFSSRSSSSPKKAAPVSATDAGETLVLDIPPPPKSHWAVRVGDTVYDLERQEDNDVSCKHRGFRKDEWSTSIYVAETVLTDEQLVQEGLRLITEMPRRYNVVSNNCQIFTFKFLHIIVHGSRQQITVLTTGVGIAATWIGRLGASLSDAPSPLMEAAGMACRAISAALHVADGSYLIEERGKGAKPWYSEFFDVLAGLERNGRIHTRLS
ncbi:hypothetical protein MSAN_01986900 [Mycena sanguinolenta]|uniref:PPPDE domain-containing protein n=1 Tax=Mycena sanguinolenta TaxID=230812 RepID=A0A8H6XNI8_9AGAR|nr:hypothetical protein MSAN_01986900 [Mycena sanguinolenta]